MRDSIGGSVVLIIIVVFIVVALGYMAFNVNYTKAFRMKNKVIAVYEDFDGNCNSNCKDAIDKYAKSIGYISANRINCEDYTSYDNLYCIKKVYEDPKDKQNYDEYTNERKYYYKVMTKINIDIPIIRNIFDLQYFQITGDTKTFTENKES